MDEMAFEPAASLLKPSHTRLKITRPANDSRALRHMVLAILSRVPSLTISRKVAAPELLQAELKEAARRHMAIWAHAAAQAGWQKADRMRMLRDSGAR